MNDFDELLKKVCIQAKAVGVPISDQIDSHVKINKRAKQRFGRCNLVGKRYNIELSEMLLTAPEFSCCQTIAHELIHTCPDCMNHGVLFKKYAALMNRAYGYDIKRTNSLDELGIQKPAEKNITYIIQCLQCRKKWLKKANDPLVQNYKKYRCTCGGKLTISKQTNNPSVTKYILQCTKCGKKIGRERLSKVIEKPQLYRCTCGGTLKRIK